MADQRITDLTPNSVTATGDVLEMVDVSANQSQKITLSQLATALASYLPSNSVGASALATATRTVMLFGIPGSGTNLPTQLPNSGNTTIYYSMVVPDDYVSGDLTVSFFARSNASGGAVALRRSLYRFRPGSVFSTVESSVNFNQTTATTNVLYFSFAIASSNLQAGDAFRVDMTRLAGDAADTNTGVFDLDAATLSYTGRV